MTGNKPSPQPMSTKIYDVRNDTGQTFASDSILRVVKKHYGIMEV